MTDFSRPAALWPAIVAAARSCIGTRFRAQGRVPGLGLDCVGVVLVAAAAAGITPVSLPPYRLGGLTPDVDMLFAASGAWLIATGLPGDVLAIVPAAGQQHFGIVTSLGLVHAHAGLGRIVEGPIDPEWSLARAWRLPGAR